MSTPTARDLMTDRVLAAQADWSLQELAQFFSEHEISGAPVVSEYGSAIGVVSLTDIARHSGEGAPEPEKEEPSAYFLGDAVTLREEILNDLQEHPQTTVKDLMMPAIFSVEEDAPIQEIADRMIRGRLHRLLVVRSGTKRDIVGLVSTLDLLEWIREETVSDDTASA